MVRSVDPDEDEEKNEPDGVLRSQNLDLREEGLQEEGEEDRGDVVGDLSSPAPVILEEDRTRPNRTGNMHHSNPAQEALWTLVQARGPNTQMPQIS